MSIERVHSRMLLLSLGLFGGPPAGRQPDPRPGPERRDQEKPGRDGGNLFGKGS
jgi:hypothetical protein